MHACFAQVPHKAEIFVTRATTSWQDLVAVEMSVRESEDRACPIAANMYMQNMLHKQDPWQMMNL